VPGHRPPRLCFRLCPCHCPCFCLSAFAAAIAVAFAFAAASAFAAEAAFAVDCVGWFCYQSRPVPPAARARLYRGFLCCFPAAPRHLPENSRSNWPRFNFPGANARIQLSWYRRPRSTFLAPTRASHHPGAGARAQLFWRRRPRPTFQPSTCPLNLPCADARGLTSTPAQLLLPLPLPLPLLLPLPLPLLLL
jgi:hypothetical protein